MKAKKKAYEAAAKCGATIDYEVGDRRWTVNVNAPDGMMWNGDTYSLVTSWLTKPTDEFWDDVRRDIESNAPHLEPEEA